MPWIAGRSYQIKSCQNKDFKAVNLSNGLCVNFLTACRFQQRPSSGFLFPRLVEMCRRVIQRGFVKMIKRNASNFSSIDHDRVEFTTIDTLWWFAALHGLLMASLTGYPCWAVEAQLA